ncbi:cytochrome c-type biogenesis protein [Candidatus Endoriftia persephonae]|jgi:cytochrome c-type biogenesis protein CcmH|uniref:Cytochrome c-type biogenesis protein n=4 Tax=Gammaproteobacteria TaxID=1236 RepID=G2FD50_9GAMM|nr:cytochrome c-type biogenesis protein [Candidatus Endoriftia persephone]EGV52173.1 cytochrome c heme lyase subunit CcmL [endosymbiont of Riftia pachyptila (vent Ph05)]EGW55430.1 cytochrome c heme lyase subunit CcmL [endosymbiont of Tevnia jerichonana (vent Tica)]KRT56407.1 Cytochrome c-type biogenesis protein CcmH/NrfF [endosymbiont of Ridgeia piscesae]KRT58132.1 cytochrome c-type biogenesis protein CcmH [endosymbiont of Ridgeia piscesae]USF88938.1 cytochrome c-type biogenesis protein CcmH [
MIRSTIFALCLLLVAASASAGTLAEFTFDDPQQTQAFRELTEKLRCLVCQNESIAGSNAELAQDLRQEIYEMMQQGQSKEQILSFMVARYGDFVLYDPPVKPSTYPLWFGPLILLLIGAVLLARTLLRKKQASETELDAEEQARLQSLLKQSSEPGNSDK